jgi:hypothetical protein
MYTTLNVKVGSKITFKLPAAFGEPGADAEGLQELDGEIVDFPKIVRVKTADGKMYDIRADQIVSESKPAPQKFGSRFQPRM